MLNQNQTVVKNFKMEEYDTEENKLHGLVGYPMELSSDWASLKKENNVQIRGNLLLQNLPEIVR